MRFRFLVFTAAFTLIQSLHAQRLPTDAHPSHYSLTITPNLNTATFTGEETIDLMLDHPSRQITLNAAEIGFVSVAAADQKATVDLDAAKEQATFTFPQMLGAGAISVKIVYTGILNDKLRGFYLSRTPDRNYGVTQFEPTDARRAFPSFDEPAMKATYDLTLVLDKSDTAISNTQIISDRNISANKHTVKFATTPKMSTYLVAFMVGSFDCVKGKADGVPIRACTTPDKVKYARYAVQSAEFLLHYYNQYFGIPYPMPKLDMVALPDFEAGAMENFGCITYRETDLLVDSKNASLSAKKNVAEVVAHEMAHQWFGDMVTMQWWDNLWLNEGFATWMERKSLAAWHPEWNMQQDRAAELNDTLDYDSDASTRTIRAEADTPDEINEMFDDIAYGKASAVLGMVEHYVGPEVFRQGVHNYLAAHLYANATAEDFWNAQTAVSHQPVDQIMQSFITQPGVPLLNFNTQNGDESQRRFYLSPEQMMRSPEVGRWHIPICLKGDAADLCKVILPGEAQSVPMPFYFANSFATGYYRAFYSPQQYSHILQAMEAKLTAPERILFVGERDALMRGGLISVADYLNLVPLLRNDKDAAVLLETIDGINGIDAHIATAEDRLRLRAWLRSQFRPVYDALGKPSKKDNFEQQNLRAVLFGILGDSNDPEILAEAKTLVAHLFQSKGEIDPSLTGVALAIAARDGDPDLYLKVQKASELVKDPGYKMDFQRTLARFTNPALVHRTLEYAVSGKVRTQDNWILLTMLLQRRETQQQAWAFIKGNWDKVQATLTTSSGARIVSATANFCTVQEHDDVQAFFATHKVDASERTLEKSLYAIDACAALRATQYKNLTTWLNEQK